MNTNTISSINLYKKYDLSWNDARHILFNNWNIPLALKKSNALTKYLTLRYTEKKLLDRIAWDKLTNKPFILLDGIKFQLVWHETTPEKCYKASIVKCSFRQFNSDFNLPAIVLITPIIES